MGCYKGVFYLYVWVGYVFLKRISALGYRRKYLFFLVYITMGLELALFTIYTYIKHMQSSAVYKKRKCYKTENAKT